MLGSLKDAQAAAATKEAARTVPGREDSGNCDIKNISGGSGLSLSMYVDEAMLSMGDMYFSQGDGEISFCGAIEIAAWLDLRVTITKDGVTAPSPKGEGAVTISYLLR